MSTQDAKDRFEELLPSLVNGTLSNAQQQWIRGYLDEHKDAHAELRWLQTLQAELRNTAPSVSPELGLDRLMARIREARRAEAEPSRVHPGPGMPARVMKFLGSLLPPPTFAVAAAAAIIVVQSGIIGSLLMNRPTRNAADDQFGATRSVRPIGGPVLQVSFKPDAREADIRMLIVRIGGTLIGGPGQLGNYLILVSPTKLGEASKTVAESGLVDDVRVLPRPPAAE